MAEVLEERPADGVALLRINRPEVLNALSIGVRRLLAEMIARLDADDEIHAIVITGDHRAFAAGADLPELLKRGVHDKAFRESKVAWTAMEDCRIPIIAAVNGFALGGGCELALHADIIIAGEGARFGLPEVRVGIMPGAGGTQRMLRAVGKYKTMRYALTGDHIPGGAAAAMGLVSECVADADVLAHAIKIASKIATLPPISVDYIKEVVNLGEDASLDTALVLENKAFQLLFATEDKNEGISAFLEKRQASFKGR